ncbi:DUF1588 domain-containing protein [Blastopirellula marina]|uniref:Cytochrome c domain-containing protein n=1 Tax=Blastopirellula marina TaxID=124 RepID=A0A2S8GJI3_9BACT|nr:DUF1588 domain-containing protein [Blastopirellula marina]PQO44174.1 hypothetical protein C5Y93_19555 [Blastopirellula marina]
MNRASSILNRFAAFWLVFCSLAVAGAAENAPELALFQRHVAPLLKKYCVDCHGPTTAEADFSLESIDPNLALGSDLEAWRLVAEQLQFGDMPPADSEQPTHKERDLLLTWIRQSLRQTQLPGVTRDEKLLLPQYGNYVDHQFLFSERLPRVTPAPPRIWRLRPDIYERQMPRLAEKVTDLANGLNVTEGPTFKDYAASYFLDEAATTPLLSNAKKIAERMIAPQSKDHALKALVSDQAPPTDQMVREAIEVAFRKTLGRAPSSEESQRFFTFYRKSAEVGDYQLAARSLLTAILLQPEVLFRQELGDGQPDEFGRVRLRSQETAFAISYSLADEPLKEFLTAAEEGKLATSAEVAALVRERLRDDSPLQEKNPRVLGFFREYFDYPFATEVFKEPPPGGTHLPQQLVADLETNIRDILRDDREVLKELLTTNDYYVNANYKPDKTRQVTLQMTTAKMQKYPTAFGLPLDWKWTLERQPISFPAEERSGVLTHPAWLAAWSGNFDNHPVQRGKWVRTHLLGGTVPDVPIGVDARVPELDHTSFRNRLAMATSATECWRCHRKMDPLGVTFERYDHYGRFQRLDAGQPVDASGEITRTGIAELDGTKVSGPTELMNVLADSEYVEQVFVRHAFRYFLGRNETLGDANTLQDAHQAYRNSGGSFRELIVSLLSSDSFLLRQSPLVTEE